MNIFHEFFGDPLEQALRAKGASIKHTKQRTHMSIWKKLFGSKESPSQSKPTKKSVNQLASEAEYVYSADPRHRGDGYTPIKMRAKQVRKFKRTKPKVVKKTVEGRETVEVVDQTVEDIAVFRLIEPVECRGYPADKLVAAYLSDPSEGSFHEARWEEAASENDLAREFVPPAIIEEIRSITGFAYKLERDW